LKKEVWNSGSLTCEKYYAGSFVYNNEGIEYILFDEGRLTLKADETYQYEYFLKDHLGNTRVVFTGQEEGLAVLQESHYYPFGMEFMGVGGEQMDVTNYYKYNGKELQDDGFDLDGNGVYESRLLWYDYGARFYDAAIGRWHVVDNKAEKYYGITQYAYAVNNPILFLDPDGNDVQVSTTKENGKNIVTFNVTMSVRKSTKISSSVINKHANGIKSQIKKSYSGYNESTNTEYRTNVTFDQNETNFVLDFVSEINWEQDGISYSSTDVAGMTNENGNVKNNVFQVLLEKTNTEGTETLQTEKETSRTGAHEYGHGTGLQHPSGDPTGNNEAVVSASESPNNLMRQAQNKTKGTEILPIQLEKEKKITEEQNK